MRMVPPPRLERGTPRSTIWCSNQLSYGGIESGANLKPAPCDCKRAAVPRTGRRLAIRHVRARNRTELFRLLLDRRHLRPNVFRLQRQHFLHVSGMNELLREIESCLYVRLSESHRLRAEVLHLGGHGKGRRVHRAGSLLCRAHKSLKGLTRLLHTFFGEIAHFARHFVSHFPAP